MFLIKKKLAHLFSVGKSLQFKRNKTLRDVLSCIPDQSSTFTAETCAELLAVEYIGNADERKFTVCADSESYLQAPQPLETEHPTIVDASTQNKPGTRTPPQPAGSQDVAVSVVTSERTRLPHRKNPRRRNPAFGHQTSDGPLRDRQAACSCKSMFF